MPQNQEGLLYYPVDIGMYNNRKVRLIRTAFDREEQLKAYATIHMLLDAIYSGKGAGKGYYIPWDEETQVLFADDYALDISWVKTLVDRCLEKEFFSKIKHSTYAILTSEHVQHNYFTVARRRFSRRTNPSKLVTSYLLMTAELKTVMLLAIQNSILVDHNGAEQSLSEFLADHFPHRKGEKKRGENTGAAPTDCPSTELDLPILTEEQLKLYGHMKNQYGMMMPAEDHQLEAVQDLYRWAESQMQHQANGAQINAREVQQLMELMLESFTELKKEDESKAGYWRDKPVLPVQMWESRTQILEHARTKFREHSQSKRYEEIYDSLDG